MKRLIAITTMLACLTGCVGAEMGNRKARLAIEQNTLPQRGHTTEQVAAWLGPANRVAPGADGHADHVEYQYVYVQMLPRHPGLIWIPIVGAAFWQFDLAEWQLDVIFDDQGRVFDVHTSEIMGVSKP